MAGQGEEAKLLGFWASPFSMRVKIALKMKGVEYEYLEQGVGNKSELLLKSNPVYKRHPVFIHAGNPICESMIIVQYINEVWANTGPSILPSDPYDCAIARFWTVYIDDKLPPVLRSLRRNVELTKEEAIEQTVSALKLLEEAIEKCSKGKNFIGGDTIGYLDIAFGSYLGWIKAIEKMFCIKLLDEAKVPHLVTWANRFCANEIVKEVMPEADKLVELIKKLQAMDYGTPSTK